MNESTAGDQPVTYSESEVPLANINQTIEEVVDIYGGNVVTTTANQVDFSLPRRRGVAASGHVAVTIAWTPVANDEGTVTITTGEEVMLGRAQRIALLVAGAIGASLFLAWPYFPGMGPLAGVGGLIAIAAYFLTLRKTQQGTVYSILQRIVDEQFARNAE